MDYLRESAGLVYRRRRRRRAVLTLIFVSILLVATLGYAASYVQGWVGKPPRLITNASCNAATSSQRLTPKGVTINVYNATSRSGLAAAVASALEKQGFQVGAINNDPLGKTILSRGEVRHGPRGTAGAILAAARLPGAALVQDSRTDATVDLVIGNRFLTKNLRQRVPASKKILAREIQVLAPHC